MKISLFQTNKCEKHTLFQGKAYKSLKYLKPNFKIAKKGPQMKTITIALIGCLLCACSAKTPTQTATDAAIQAIDALEQSITPECKTASVDKQITALRTQVENTVTYCEQEKRELQLEKDRLEIILFFLVVAMGFYITRKIINA